jgi:hypothetical protein
MQQQQLQLRLEYDLHTGQKSKPKNSSKRSASMRNLDVAAGAASAHVVVISKSQHLVPVSTTVE